MARLSCGRGLRRRVQIDDPAVICLRPGDGVCVPTLGDRVGAAGNCSGTYSQMSPLLLLVGLGLGGYLAVWRNKRALKVKARRRR